MDRRPIRWMVTGRLQGRLLSRLRARPEGTLCVNADGTDVRRLAEGALPDWSPDGLQIVFETWKESQICVINADGTGIRRLTRGKGAQFWPDGSKILFAPPHDLDDSMVFGDRSINVINADGSGARTLIGAKDFPGYKAVRFRGWHWSPDGSKIAFALLVDTDLAEGMFGILSDDEQHLYVMNADGTRLRRLWRQQGSIEGFDWR